MNIQYIRREIRWWTMEIILAINIKKNPFLSITLCGMAALLAVVIAAQCGR